MVMLTLCLMDQNELLEATSGLQLTFASTVCLGV